MNLAGSLDEASRLVDKLVPFRSNVGAPQSPLRRGSDCGTNYLAKRQLSDLRRCRARRVVSIAGKLLPRRGRHGHNHPQYRWVVYEEIVYTND